MLFHILSWGCATASLAAFLYKLPKRRGGSGSIVLYALCTYFLFNSWAYFVDLEVFRQPISRFFSFPNITTIAVQASVVVLTAAQQVAILYLVLPPDAARKSARRQITGFGIALVVLILLFVAVRPTKVASAQETIYLNIADTGYAIYMAYYVTICAIGRVQTVLFAFRYARTIRERWLRLGMWFVANGSALILVYCAVRYWQILALHTAFVTVAPWKFLFWFVSDVGTLLQMFGWTVPSWGPRLGLVAAWLRDYRSYRQLGPLWRAVSRAAPEVALEPPRHRLLDRIPPRRLAYRLYRRVIEIRDGQLLLERNADPIAVHRLEQARGMSHEFLCEAAVLRSALDAAQPRTPEGQLPNRRTADVSLPQEINRLTRVSRAFESLAARRPAGGGTSRGAGPGRGRRTGSGRADRPEASRGAGGGARAGVWARQRDVFP